MLPALLGYAGKKLATSAIGGIAKKIGSSIFGGKDDDEPKKEMSKNLFKSDEEKAEDEKKGVGGTLSKIRKSIFGGDSSSEGGVTSKIAVKRESKVVVDAVNNSNQILGDILSTLQQSLALQQSVVKPSREELLEESQAAFAKDGSKSVGSKIAASQKKGMGVGGALALGAAGLAGIAGVQGFMNAEETFDVDEATMSQKLASALGNIVEKATFGLVKNKDIAGNIDSFFTTISTKFSEGTKFLEKTLGVKFGSDEGDGFFATIGRKISEGYTAFMESDAVKAIRDLVSGVFNMDAEKTKEATKKISDMITGVFQKMFDAILDAIGGISIPSNKFTNAIGIGGRSISNIISGEVATKQDKAQADLDKAQQQYDKFKEDTPLYRRLNPFGDEEAEERRLRENLRQAQKRYDELEESGEGGERISDIEKEMGQGTLQNLIPDQTGEDSVRAQAGEARSLQFKREINRRQENMEIVLPDKATTTNVNNAMAVNTVRKDTVVSQTLRPRVNSSAYENFLEKNTSFA